MKRLVTALAGVGLMLALAPPAVSPAASNNATTLTPLPDGTQLETFVRLDCHHANGSCDFTVGADRRAGDGVTGFPNDLWSRQSTTIRPSDRLTYLDVHATAQYDRVNQRRRFRRSHHHLHGRRARWRSIRPSAGSTRPSWRTGQPSLDVNVIACTHIQVVYSGVNITSPSTCAQANFS